LPISKPKRRVSRIGRTFPITGVTAKKVGHEPERRFLVSLCGAGASPAKCEQWQ